MSAIFGDLPRKRLSPEERKQNVLNAAMAAVAQRKYDEGEAALRAEIEHRYGVAFEIDDDGHWYVDDRQVLGEYDVERFTPEQLTTYNLWRETAKRIIERTRITWPEVRAKTSKVKVVRWRTLPSYGDRE